MARFTGLGIVAAIGCLVVGGAVWGGMKFAGDVEDDLARPPGASVSASPSPVGQKLSPDEQAELGKTVATLDEPSVRVHQAVWVDQEMRAARMPVVITNTGDAPERVQVVIRISAGPNGTEVSLYDGTIDSERPIAPGASLVTQVEVGSVQALDDLRAQLRPVTGGL